MDCAVYLYVLPPNSSQDQQESTKRDTEPILERSRINRRTFLTGVGSGAILGGLGSGTTWAARASQTDSGGPPNPSEWSLEFESQFEGDSLDTSKWNLGWGWGNTTSTSSTQIVEENVAVQDGALRLIGTHEDDTILSGAVNTRDTMTFGPGTYFEARIQFANRVGFHPAFWAKPVEYSWWPPEIDVVELLQDGSGDDDTHEVSSFLHYSESTEPGDESTHNRIGASYRPGDNVTENFHVYAAEWQSDGITIYVDGEEVQTFTNETMLTSMQKATPFYINISQNITVNSPIEEYVGSADMSESWGDQTVIDSVRLWKQ